MNIGIRIKDFRMKSDQTLKQISKATGLSIGYLSDIERGRTNPSIETCQKLAHFYKTTLSNLFSGVEVDVTLQDAWQKGYSEGYGDCFDEEERAEEAE